MQVIFFNNAALPPPPAGSGYTGYTGSGFKVLLLVN